MAEQEVQVNQNLLYNKNYMVSSKWGGHNNGVLVCG